MITIHLIANAHLDPVWLWDWREGLNEGITTCRTMLGLMDEFPEFTFIRGEAAIYQHIEQHDPVTFRRIQRAVQAGRWEIVGGTYIQPDTNLPATETFLRHFTRAQNYFQTKFNFTPTVAWAADSFGHSGGLPDILAAAGMRGFVFTRPAEAQCHLPAPVFRWEGVGGGSVMAYRPPDGNYLTERVEMPARLDLCVHSAQKHRLAHVACFYGLGNHGGGATRRQLGEIREWAARHPEVRVIHSGLHRLLQAVRTRNLPVHRGELNFCNRGCYSSAARLKFAYRKAEALVSRAETTGAAISAALGGPPPNLREAWDAVLFNSFHDILPGSSIERGLEDQLQWVNSALYQSQRAELTALNTLAAHVDTTVPKVTGDQPTAVPFLVWNPQPHEFIGHIELEAALDYRPLFQYQHRPDEIPVEVRGADGRRLPFQVIAHEHNFYPTFYPWRKRVVVPVKLPALGWNVISVGYVEGATQRPRPAVKLPVRIAGNEIRLWEKIRLSAVTVEDPWGSWGGINEEPESFELSKVRHRWKVTRRQVVETGPECTTLWMEMTGGQSRLELHFTQYRGRAALDVQARVVWNDRSARLKLAFAGLPAGEAEFEVPGGAIRRGPAGEVPGGRWVRVGNFGFASDALYNFDTQPGVFRTTVVRGARFAAGEEHPEPWKATMDQGELKFRFLVTPVAGQLARLAQELEQPPIAQTVSAKPGKLARVGSLVELPAGVRLLALKPAEDGRGWILRVQGTGRNCTWLGQRLRLPTTGIATWRLVRAGTKWKASLTTVTG
ncbi:MAG: hypothetical protein PCFJNLEI_00233 [Verrucomicrobiae bacterium]|nr:hypothetical protein [Verrucomicrobiae bacterium]